MKTSSLLKQNLTHLLDTPLKELFSNVSFLSLYFSEGAMIRHSSPRLEFGALLILLVTLTTTIHQINAGKIYVDQS